MYFKYFWDELESLNIGGMNAILSKSGCSYMTSNSDGEGGLMLMWHFHTSNQLFSKKTMEFLEKLLFKSR